MQLKTTAQALEIVGPQEYSLAFNGSVSGIRNPLEIWSPPSNRRILTADELYDLFSKECVAFLGDSTERRAADTLQILLSNRHNVSGIQKYYHWYEHTHADNYRVNIVDGVKRTKECFPGTIDSVHLPTYDKILKYKYPHEDQKNYSIIVASTGPWNQKAGPKSPNETRERIRQVITHLHNEIPDDVLLIWKTGVWSWYGDWKELKDNETIEVGKVGNNYLVHYANQVAKETILAINSTRLLLLDFATEICPYSWEYRVPTNMAAENEDRVPWHYGAKARLLLAQMVGWEVASYRNSTLSSGGFGNIGRGIESGKNSSQNSTETFQGSANDIISESNEIHPDDDENKHRIEANATTTQVADPPIEKSAMNVSESLVDSIALIRSASSAIQNDDNKHKIEQNSTTSQVVDQPIENGTFPGKSFPTNSSAPVFDSITLRNHTRNPKIVPETPSISFVFKNPNSSFGGEAMRFGAIFVVLYGLKMKMKSRSKSSSESLEVESSQIEQ